MATIQEQLENAVAIYNKCAGKVNKFINGGDTETIESDSGNKPTLAKIAKDAKDTVDSSIISLTEKAKQVANDKNEILQIKDDVEAIKTNVDDKAIKFGIPIGQLSWFVMTEVPDGYLRCDGSEITKEMFPDLCKVLNNGDETALTATLPNALTTDGRGRFLRDIGISGTPLEIQEDEIRAHSHDIAVNWNDHNTWAGIDATSAHHSKNYSTKPFGGDETRPVSLMAVLCIKAFNGVINDNNVDAIALSIQVQTNKANIELKNQEVILWESSTGSTGTITLNQSYKNFKWIVPDVRQSNLNSIPMPMLVSDIDKQIALNKNIGTGIGGAWIQIKFLNETQIKYIAGHQVTMFAFKGIK